MALHLCISGKDLAIHRSPTEPCYTFHCKPCVRRQVHRILLSKADSSALLHGLSVSQHADLMVNEVGFGLKMNISTSLLYLKILQFPSSQNASPPSKHHATQQKKI